MKIFIFSFLIFTSLNSFAENVLGRKLAELAGAENSVGEIEELFRFNSPYTIDFKSYDSTGDNPIQAAVTNKRCENIKPILAYSDRLLNFDVNEKDNIFNYSPLEFAAVNSSRECINSLITFKGTNLNSFLSGANKNIFQVLVENKNLEGVTKIVMEERFQIDQKLPLFDDNSNLLWLLSLNGAVDLSFENEVGKILINNAANVNFQNAKGQNALMISAFFGNLAMLKNLIERNANLLMTDYGNHTVIDYANANKHQDIIEYINSLKK